MLLLIVELSVVEKSAAKLVVEHELLSDDFNGFNVVKKLSKYEYFFQVISTKI